MCSVFADCCRIGYLSNSQCFWNKIIHSESTVRFSTPYCSVGGLEGQRSHYSMIIFSRWIRFRSDCTQLNRLNHILTELPSLVREIFYCFWLERLLIIDYYFTVKKIDWKITCMKLAPQISHIDCEWIVNNCRSIVIAVLKFLNNSKS